jgi:hypothetical protein
MFAGLVLIMLIGFPVAFSLSALGLLCAFVAIEMGWFPVDFIANLPFNVFGILSNDLLLAIPFFTLMGSILEKCGLAEDMLDSMGSSSARPRRARLLGDHHRVHPRRDHRDGRRAGDRDGDDLAAGDGALRLQHALRHRGARRLRHDHAARAAVARARRAGGPARRLRRATCTRAHGDRRSSRC